MTVMNPSISGSQVLGRYRHNYRTTATVQTLSIAAVATCGIQIKGIAVVDLNPSDIFIVSAAILAGFEIAVPPPRMRRGLTLLLLGFMVGATAGIVYGLPVAWNLSRLTGIAAVALYYLTAYHSVRTGLDYQLLRALVVAAVVPNALAVISGPWSAWLQSQPRLSGGMHEHISNGTLIACALLIVIFAREVVKPTVARLLLTGTLGYFLILTESRAAMVAVLAGVIFGALMLARLRVSPRRVVVPLAALALSLVLMAVLGVISRVIGNIRARPDTLERRESLLQLAGTLFGDYPITGAGFFAAKESSGSVIHATLFGLTAEAGALAGLGFLLFFLTPLLLAWKQLNPFVTNLRQQSQGPAIVACAAVAAAMLVSSFAFDAIFQRHWWIVLGLLVGLVQSAQGVGALGERSQHRAEIATA
jgi:O-Antigen ligase